LFFETTIKEAHFPHSASSTSAQPIVTYIIDSIIAWISGKMTAMPDDTIDPLEILWDSLLSRERAKVTSAFSELSLDEKKAVITHLKRMVSESGWHREQQVSAQTALSYLGISSLE
jgi:hypothetical protein